MRKKQKRLVALLLSLLMVISLLPTTGLTVEAAAKPTLAKKSSSIVIGGTSKIKVKNAPNGAKITYKSAKKNIATVSKQGAVKGIKNGTTKITVSVKKNSKTTKLTYNVTVRKPKLSKSKLSLASRKTAKLSVKNKPKKAKYTWQSSNTKIATVNKNGKVVAKGKGTANIRVKVKTTKKTYSLSCKVTVKSKTNNPETQTYTVTFDSNGGSAVTSQTVKKNGFSQQPTDPTRDGYTFDGWYTQAKGGQKFNFNTAITGNITLYAHWNAISSEEPTPTPATYTVTFDSNGGSSVESQIVEKNALANHPIDPIRDGYAFDGWYTEANGGQKFNFNTAITGNITLYAHWNIFKDKKTVCSVTDVKIISDEVGSAYSAITVNSNPGNYLQLDIFNDQPLENIMLSTLDNPLITLTSDLLDYCEQEILILPVKCNLPEYYVICATLKDSDGNALSEPFVCVDYTSEYAEFAEKTIADFESSAGTVLNFDEDDTNNFGVLNPSVITITTNDTSNIIDVTEIENGNDTDFIVPNSIYTFVNPDESVLSLESGDRVFIEGTTYLFKVGSISKTEDIITIVPSNDVELTDFYDFLKVDFSETPEARGVVNEALKKSVSLTVNRKFGKNERVTVSGSLDVSTTTELRLAYDIKWGGSYFECSVKPKLDITLKGQIEAKISSTDQNKKEKAQDELTFGNYKVPSPVAGLSVYVKPSIPVELSLAGSASVELNASIITGYTYNSKSGIQKVDKKDISAKLDAAVEVEFKLGPKIEVGLSFIEIFKASVSAQAGLKISTNYAKDILTTEEREYKHACGLCLEGTSKSFLSANGKLEMDLPGKKLDLTASFNIVTLEAAISPFKEANENTPDVDKEAGNFYISLVNDVNSPFGGVLHLGSGTCPNKKWKTVFKAVDMDGNAINDIEVCVTGNAGTVTFNGMTQFYEFLYNGEYTAECTINGTNVTQDFTVNKAKQDVLLRESRVLVYGSVTDAITGEGIPNATVIAIAPDGNTAAQTTTSEHGDYQLRLPMGIVYTFRISADSYESMDEMCLVDGEMDFPVDIGLQPTDTHRYERFDIGMTWTEAKAYCESLGGHLVTITSAEEQTYVESLVVAGTQNQYWLGGYNDDSWKWVTGETWSYSHWASGEPNDYRNNESYAQIYRIRNPHSGGAALHWNDITVDNHISDEEDFFTTDQVGFICEWD